MLYKGKKKMQTRDRTNTKLTNLTYKNYAQTPIFNRPRSIYQYSNLAPRLSGQTSIFGVVFFVSKSLLGIEGQRKLEKFSCNSDPKASEPCSNIDISNVAYWNCRCVK